MDYSSAHGALINPIELIFSFSDRQVVNRTVAIDNSERVLFQSCKLQMEVLGFKANTSGNSVSTEEQTACSADYCIYICRWQLTLSHRGKPGTRFCQAEKI